MALNYLMNIFRFFFTGFIFLILSAILWPSVSGAQPTKEDLIVGVEEVDGFDAIKSGFATISTAIVVNTILEPLFYMNEKMELIPVLGLSATPSNDGKSWTVTLRKGVVFHDGTPFTSDAVTAHWNRILDPKNRFKDLYLISPIASVEKIDNHTVRFNLNHPWLAFKGAISWNRSYTALIPSPKAVAEDSHHSAPIGTGAFRFVEWKRSDYVIVEKNKDYWNTGRTLADRIVFRIIPDHQTRYAALEAGEINFIYTDRGNHIRQAQGNSAFQVFVAEDNGAETILLNNTQPPLDDVRVRKASLHAWDQARYISISYKDTIPKVKHTFGNSFKCSNLAYPEYDPETAKALLSEYGKPVKIEYLHTNTSRGREAGQIIQQLFKTVGIETTLIPMDIGPIVKKVMQGNYQMASWRVSSAPDQGPALYRNYHSKSRANFSNYTSPEMDELLESQRLETDPDRRHDLLCRVASKVNSDAVTMFRGGCRYHFITDRKVDKQLRIFQGVPLFRSVLMNE